MVEGFANMMPNNGGDVEGAEWWIDSQM